MTTMFPVLGSLLTQSPVYLVWIGGLVLAAMRWQRHPRMSLLVTIALAGLLLVSVIDTYLSISMPMWILDRGMSSSEMSYFFMGKAIIGAIVRAALWGLLIAAIFIPRQPSEQVNL